MAEKGTAPSGNARYLILEVPEPVAREKRILGSIVPFDNLYDPFRHYRPYLEDPHFEQHPNDLKKLEDLSDWLWKEKPGSTVHLTNNEFERSSTSQTDAQAQLTDLFRASIAKFKGHDVRITAGEAKRYTINDVAPVLSTRMVTNEPWLAELNKIYDEIRRPGQGSVCLVTGIYTCKGLEVSWKKEEERSGGAAAQLPIGQAAVGDPVIAAKLNIGLKFDAKKSEGSTVFARCDDEVVFALAYDELDLIFEDDPEPPKQKGFWKSLFRSDSMPRTNNKLKIIGATLGKPIRGDGIQPFASGKKDADSGEFGYNEPDAIIVPRPQPPRDAPPEMDNGHA